MIQLQVAEKPAQLTPEVVAKLTEEYKNDKNKSVWKKDYITKSLLIMSFGKCCFCETNVNEESKYMEVEHFHPKSLYEDEVVDWSNLLPICSRCNTKKSDHDTKQEPIIHPVKDTPKQHLKLQDFRFYGLTELGKCTIDVTDLNNRQRLVNVRYEIGIKISEELENLIESAKGYTNNPSTRGRNKIVSTLKNLMLEGIKESEYSATTATIILTNPNYTEIQQTFIAHNLWNAEFEDLEQQVNYCALI